MDDGFRCAFDATPVRAARPAQDGESRQRAKGGEFGEEWGECIERLRAAEHFALEGIEDKAVRRANFS